MSRGRISKYETDVKTRFEELEKWLKSGATDKEIAGLLNINAGTLCDYKNKYPEFSEFIKKCRKTAVLEVKAALFKRACGYDYSEKKTVTINVKFPESVARLLRDSGVNVSELETPQMVKTELTEKQVAPDPASAMILLKHWAKDEKWTNDPQMLEMKKQELELKKKIAKEKEW